MDKRLAFSLSEFKKKCKTKEQRIGFNKLLKTFDDSENQDSIKVTPKLIIDTVRNSDDIKEAIDNLRPLSEELSSLEFNSVGKSSVSKVNIIKGKKISYNGNSYYKVIVIEDSYDSNYPNVTFKFLNSRTNDLIGFGIAVKFNQKLHKYTYQNNTISNGKIDLAKFTKLIISTLK